MGYVHVRRNMVALGTNCDATAVGLVRYLGATEQSNATATDSVNKTLQLRITCGTRQKGKVKKCVQKIGNTTRKKEKKIV